MSTATKRILITGAGSGIGHITALELSKNEDYHITITTRSGKSEQTLEALRKENPSAKLDAVEIDLQHMPSVVRGAEELQTKQPFDIVVFNAGLMLPSEATTENGMEMTFSVNYLAHHFLAFELLRSRPEGHKIHFVLLSSVMIKMVDTMLPIWRVPRKSSVFLRSLTTCKKSSWKEYAMSKYYLTVLATVLAAQPDASATAVNPGNSMTGIARNLAPKRQAGLSIFKSTLITPEEAAGHVIRACEHPLAEGLYYDKSKVSPLPKRIRDEKLAALLLDVAQTMLERAGVDENRSSIASSSVSSDEAITA